MHLSPYHSPHRFLHLHPVRQLLLCRSILRQVHPLPLCKEGCALADWPNNPHSLVSPARGPQVFFCGAISVLASSQSSWLVGVLNILQSQLDFCVSVHDGGWGELRVKTAAGRLLRDVFRLEIGTLLFALVCACAFLLCVFFLTY